jgi:predicted nucleic acid-binding protein
MNKVFVDSDIILDMEVERNPFYEPAAKVFELGYEKKLELYTTAVVLSNVFYISRKKYGSKKTVEDLKKMHTVLKILPIDKEMVGSALYSDFKDFEDALQYFAVKSSGVSVILTRNLTDYKVADLKVQTAEDYIEGLLESLEKFG